ncbi:hypothetical protein [Roseomonas haemaphysalidis]|uniref:Uncharacterized protein n=1 Tax=Roseomonas haemaphysalidis TaxID=2768162 RepID=A0ABS3KJZ5_9PROT|nr:hypothetical protein [Roseomonas haemaphysalidis]MBO1077775.1 hypothetical protein [Roseomonas haemaphysalidis]
MDPGTSAVARQRRYRANKAIGSLDMARSVLLRLETLRNRTGLTNEQLLTQALDLLEAQQTQPTRKSARRPARPVATPAEPADLAKAVPPKSKRTSPVDVGTDALPTQLDLLGDPVPSSVKRPRKR